MSALSGSGNFHHSNAVRVQAPVRDAAAPAPAAAGDRDALLARGLEHARAEWLEGADAAAYAAWFVDGKALRLDDDHAVAFASAALYFAIVSEDVLLGRGVEQDYDVYTRERFLAPFEEALGGGASAVEALGRADEAFRVTGRWWPLATLEGAYEGTLAEDYAEAFARTDEVGLAAHQYAAFYAGNRYLEFPEEESLAAGRIIARAYRESDQAAAQLRIKYASAYLAGYQHAQSVHFPDEPGRLEWWADVYAGAYVTGWLRVTGRGWLDATSLAFGYAHLYTHAWVDWGYGRRTASLLADAHLRGEYHATLLGLGGDAYDDYAWEYHLAYYGRFAELRWDEERSHAYAAAYTDARAAGQGEDEAHTTAAAAVEADAAAVDAGE